MYTGVMVLRRSAGIRPPSGGMCTPWWSPARSAERAGSPVRWSPHDLSVRTGEHGPQHIDGPRAIDLQVRWLRPGMGAFAAKLLVRGEGAAERLRCAHVVEQDPVQQIAVARFEQE